MKHYTGYEWMLIEVANHFGLDKKVFEERIQWTKDHMGVLEQQEPEDMQYWAAVNALRDVQAGKSTGYMVSCDSASSGVQLMSVLTGCKTGCENTGLVFEDVRPDAYTKATEIINQKVSGYTCTRKAMKEALMTAFYGSVAVPERLFGKETDELAAFYEAMDELAPGANGLLKDLVDAWQPWAKVQEWTMPDGFDVRIKAMQMKETRIEIDELDHHQMTFAYFVNEGTKKGVSTVANAIHSFDALVVRTLHRKCNYDLMMVIKTKDAMCTALKYEQTEATGAVAKYKTLYESTGLADVVVLPFLVEGATGLSKKHLNKLIELVDSMLEHYPFELVTIH